VKKLNKAKATEKIRSKSEMYASVCNSCACSSGGYACVHTSCKGCKDSNVNVAEVKNIYSKK